MSFIKVARPDFMEAAELLSAFVERQAIVAAASLGFGWVGEPDAPDTYPDLQAAFSDSQRSAKPMPVSSLYCDNVIYQKPETNFALRFWHDTLHVQTGLTFALDDELELGLRHLKIAEANGINKHSLAWRILRIDMLGQNYLLGIAKRFPLDQARFVHGCLERGLDEGVLQEVRLVAA